MDHQFIQANLETGQIEWLQPFCGRDSLSILMAIFQVNLG